jgi:acyl carrier protein
MRTEKANVTEDFIREYLMENVDATELDNDEDMFETGLVNSLFAIQLMTFLEQKFQIKVTMDDLDMDNFKSINAIAEFVKSKEGESKDA